MNPLGDKVRQGDGGTPEGRFYICRSEREPGKAKYGARSMLLSYPSAEDARRGLQDKLIDKASYTAIISALKKGAVPPQQTPLGGSLRIHGGGAGTDWTLGCVAMNDADIVELFDIVPSRVRVDVFARRPGKEGAARADSSQLQTQRLVLDGAKKQTQVSIRYTSEAMQYQSLAYPMGDIAADESVCSDVVIRAARQAHIDLQALVHEDFVAHPKAYSAYGASPDANIDHRRVRCLRIFFERHGLRVPDDAPYAPGEIVLMDTGIRNGTPYDHIGVVGDETNEYGELTVINNWAPGATVRAQSLLNGEYPEIVGRYRLPNAWEFH